MEMREDQEGGADAKRYRNTQAAKRAWSGGDDMLGGRRRGVWIRMLSMLRS